eukprot:526747-Rhodomonas_salina.2
MSTGARSSQPAPWRGCSSRTGPHANSDSCSPACRGSSAGRSPAQGLVQDSWPRPRPLRHSRPQTRARQHCLDRGIPERLLQSNWLWKSQLAFEGYINNRDELGLLWLCLFAQEHVKAPDARAPNAVQASAVTESKPSARAAATFLLFFPLLPVFFQGEF